VRWTRKEFLKNTTLVGAAALAGVTFLRPARARSGGLRPPGALPESEFLSRCIRCGRCADACPNRSITAFQDAAERLFSASPGRAEAGTPILFPRQQACNLCHGARSDVLLCTEACPTGALERVAKDEVAAKVSMGRARIDRNLCYSYQGSSCGVCVRSCPFEGKALRAGHFETPLLDPSQCVGCGLCERACIRYPQAITVVPRSESA